MDVIQSFGDADSKRVWDRQHVPRLPPDVIRRTHRKLAILDAAENLDDLRSPPGNRVEKLKGDRAGQHSIRVNDRWRLCFGWTDAGPEDVELTDHHD